MNLEHLFDSVYEKPGDDRRRLVLADALLERGDPRGELIMLQFQTHAVARKRAKKLIDRHRRHFLGPLSDVVRHGSDEWHKGFLVGCVAQPSSTVSDCPAWSTVRRLGVMVGGVLDPDVLASKWLRSLEEVRLYSDHESFWVRAHQLTTVRAQLIGVLERANRLKLLKT